MQPCRRFGGRLLRVEMYLYNNNRAGRNDISSLQYDSKKIVWFLESVNDCSAIYNCFSSQNVYYSSSNRKLLMYYKL